MNKPNHIYVEKPLRTYFPSLFDETRVRVNTATAAHHLNLKPQTLLKWSCLESGPIRPVRINGRLAWSVSEIKKLLGVPA